MRRRVLALLLLAGCDQVFGLERDPSENACPGTYAPIENAPYLYRLDDRLLDWQAAADECRGDTVAHITHLVVFDDTTDLVAVQSALLGGMPPFVYVHVGYARDASAAPLERASFRSVIDTEVYAPLWNVSEPDNHMQRGETIVALGAASKLVDSAPRTPSHFICACDQQVANKTFEVE